MSGPLLTIAQARELVLSETVRLPGESVPITEARDRVLAADLAAAGDVPPFPCSAMDGYAVQPGPAGRTLRIVGESRAGTPSPESLGDGEAIRISTGGAIPAGATAVIPQENVETTEGAIITRAEVRENDHIRDRGEDMRAGTTILGAGTVLGAAEITVAKRPRVRVLSTGDELRAPGEQLGPGEIHNSNGPMLIALAEHRVSGPGQ